MNASFVQISEIKRRAGRASALGLVLTLFAGEAALAEPGTPEQRKACTPDV